MPNSEILKQKQSNQPACAELSMAKNESAPSYHYARVEGLGKGGHRLPPIEGEREEGGVI